MGNPDSNFGPLVGTRDSTQFDLCNFRTLDASLGKHRQPIATAAGRRIALRPPGFTLIELLVVISIVGALVAIIVPAVQSARESARRATCSNHLRQLGIALLTHSDHHGVFPFGGWGREWVGVPGRGSRERQPGGWAYSILPYLERRDLHDMGAQQYDGADFSQRLETPISEFICPSRRAVKAGPIVFPHVARPKPAGSPTVVARSDYAINSGASHIQGFRGPPDLEQGDDHEFWLNRTHLGSTGHGTFTGISHLRRGAPLKAVLDGTSNTYLAGEKYLAEAHYESGESQGDNESLYSGYCNDLHRFTGNLHALTGLVFLSPSADRTTQHFGSPGFLRFGSAHPETFGMVYCDGAVRWRALDIAPETHLRSGHRSDLGAPIEELRLNRQ